MADHVREMKKIKTKSKKQSVSNVKLKSLTRFQYMSFLVAENFPTLFLLLYTDAIIFHENQIYVYLVLQIILVMPYQMLLLFLGFYSKCGFVKIWNLMPLFRGIGFAEIANIIFVIIVSGVYTGMPIIFIYRIIAHGIPWDTSCKVNCTLTVMGNVRDLYRYDVFKSQSSDNRVFNLEWISSVGLCWIVLTVLVALGVNVVKRLLAALLTVAIITLSAIITHSVAVGIREDYRPTREARPNRYFYTLWVNVSLGLLKKMMPGPLIVIGSMAPAGSNPKTDVILSTLISQAVYLLLTIFLSLHRISNIAYFEAMGDDFSGSDIMYAIIPVIITLTTGRSVTVVLLYYLSLLAISIVSLTIEICALIQSVSEYYFEKHMTRNKLIVSIAFCLFCAFTTYFIILNKNFHVFYELYRPAASTARSWIVFLFILLLICVYNQLKLETDVEFVFGYRSMSYWTMSWNCLPFLLFVIGASKILTGQVDDSYRLLIVAVILCPIVVYIIYYSIGYYLQLDETDNSATSHHEDFQGLSKNRSCTDIICLVLMAFFMSILLVCIGYCMMTGDIKRIVNGYDDCANVCGVKNYPNPDIKSLSTCKAEDMTKKKYLMIFEADHIIVNPDKVKRKCVTNCSEEVEFEQFLNRCIPKKDEDTVNRFFSKTGLTNFFQEVSEDLHMCWPEIISLCLIAFVLSILLMILFRYAVGLVVWIVLIGVVSATISGTIYLWYLWKHQKNYINSETNPSDVESGKVSSYLAFAILATIATAIVLLVILVMRKRIQLVIELFKESGKAISAMPLLVFQPILTFVCLGIVATLWVYFTIWIESSGQLTELKENSYGYQKNALQKLTRWYNLLAFFWMTQFLIGCQHMVIAGAVSTWFFTRNKDKLDSPISTSFSNLCTFHLGTVAMGSLLIALVQFIRTILKVIEYQFKGKQNAVANCVLKCCQCCLACFEKFLQYLTRNAYIVTAMYGYSFCRAGQQAFKLLTSNALRVIAINSVGDFVLFLGKVLIVTGTVLIGVELIQKKEGVQHAWVPLTLVGVFAYLVIHCFITVYEMAIDTIFLCFCEDCEMNDGISKPYYMSRNLMEFVQNSKKALEVHDSLPLKGEAWTKENSPATISENIP